MKKRKAVIGIFLALGCMAFCGGFSTLSTSNFSAKGELSSVFYEDTYILGDTLSIQEAKILYAGTEYEAQGILHFPSGKAFRKESMVLTESGQYTLEYKAQAGDTVLSESVTITVQDIPYYLSGGGEVVYGTNQYVGEGIEGVNVSASRGTTFRYNSVIDVSDNTKDDLLLKLYCTPKTQGAREVERFIVRLTDIYNAENYVDFIYRAGDASGESSSYTYITANANGQLPSGVEKLNKETNNSVTYEDEYYRLFQDDKYGFNGMATFNGLLPKYLPGGVFKNNAHELKLDYESKKIYGQRASVGTSNFVIDLDAQEFFGKNVWQGFTTGEVIMSISSVGNGAEFNYFIAEIDGHDLSKAGVKNTKAPWIAVDYANYDSNDLPNAVVGKPYRLFKAAAYDDFESVNCEASVYYNYDNSSRSQQNIAGGAFIPKRAGIYTIVYKANDSFGNQTTELVQVEAIERDTLDYAFGERQTAGDVGTEIEVASVEIHNALVGAKISRRVVLVGSDIVYDIADGANVFLPKYAGTYKVEYTYSDYVQSEVFSYEVMVNAIEKPKLFGNPILPKYLLKNCTYTFPKFVGYDFSDGTKEIDAEIYISEDKATPFKLNGNTYKVENASEQVEVFYRVHNAYGMAERSYKMTVVEAGYGRAGQLNLSKYLYSEAFTATMTETDITYTTNSLLATGGNATLELINAAYLNVFEVTFGVPSGNNAYNGVTITLTDETDESNRVVIFYGKNATGASICVHYDGKTAEGQSSSSFEGDKAFSVSVKNDRLTFAESDFSLPVAEVFAAFSAKKFYVTIGLEGITGNAAISFTKLMNQAMKNSRNDGVSPILIYTPFEEEYHLGDTFVIDRFDYYDFVDPSPTFSYTVRDKSGNYAVSKEGVVMDGKQNDYRLVYTLDGSTYETYTISGMLMDYGENPQRFPYMLKVVDEAPPTLKLDVQKTAYKVGDTVAVATYEAADAHCSVNVFIVVALPNGHVKQVVDGKFKAEQKGSYTVTYRAMDEEGNVVFAAYNVVVN